MAVRGHRLEESFSYLALFESAAPPIEFIEPTKLAATRSNLRLWIGLGVVVALGGVIAIHTAWSAIRLPLFYDEMWRVDFIRSSDPAGRMLTHDTPIPIGFVWIMALVTGPFPNTGGLFRMVSIACTVALTGVVFLTLARISTLRTQRGSLRSARSQGGVAASLLVVAGAAAVGLTTLWGFGMHDDFFNNYPFEALYLGLLVYFALELEREDGPGRGFSP